MVKCRLFLHPPPSVLHVIITLTDTPGLLAPGNGIILLHRNTEPVLVFKKQGMVQRRESNEHGKNRTKPKPKTNHETAQVNSRLTHLNVSLALIQVSGSHSKYKLVVVVSNRKCKGHKPEH